MRARFHSRRSISISAIATLGPAAALALAQDYRVERIASGLNQPTFVTQAPGDPSNILYFTERTANAVAGFNAANQMGKVWRYDVNTRTKQLVLDLSSRSVTQDTGLTAIAFHPDFNIAGSDGFGKMYVSSSEAAAPAGPLNRIEEYTVAPGGGGGTASLSRTILQYNNSGTAFQNHTLNWIGFDPTATGAARTQLYASTGDGRFSLPDRPSQDPNEIQGKMLRFDVSNASPTPQVYITGLRNASRASFDRANGDLYWGDVGESVREELDFLKAGTHTATPLPDYGWPQREGMENGIQSPFAVTNPYTGAASRNPIREYPHTGGGEAIIGGYVYRGPVASLQGKYFYGDFVKQTLFALDFDRNTDPFSFNGSNGTLTDMTAAFNSTSVLYDPSDPTYTQANSGSLWGIDHIVSFGEDNAGNLYVVDFGFGTGFNGQYPGAGLGEIFKISTVSSVWNVNANGTWSSGSNWRLGAPNAISARATFGSAITSPRTVTVDSAQTVGSIVFDNANKYTIAGSSTLTLDVSSGSAAVTVVSGSHTISAPVALADATTFTVTPVASTLTVSNLQSSSVAITKAGAGTLVLNRLRAGTLNVNTGTVTIAPSTGSPSSLGLLAISAGAKLDLTDNDLILTTTSKSSVESHVATRRLTSSLATASSATALGVLDGAEFLALGNSSFNGVPVTPTDVLVQYTWNGDANFDGRVTFDDYVRIDTGFNTHLTGWLNGDFDYSGAVNFDDYVLIDIAFNQQNGTLSRAIDWISGDDRSGSGHMATGVRTVIEHFDRFGVGYARQFLASVPEPLNLVWIAAIGGSMAARRRRPN